MWNQVKFFGFFTVMMLSHMAKRRRMAELCALPCGGAKTGGGGGGGGYQRQGKNELVGVCITNAYMCIKLQSGTPSMIPKAADETIVDIWIGFISLKNAE